MCHQSVGLIQGALESIGITTISMTLHPEITYHVGVPRATYIRYPNGNPYGLAQVPQKQRIIIQEQLNLLPKFKKPGDIIQLPFKWRRD
jgi:hypothetical protein